MAADSLIFDRPYSRVLHYDAGTGKAKVLEFGLRAEHLGGSGLAAALYASMNLCALPHDAPEQPIIFTVGPLTGLYPLMSKAVCGFRSPYTGQWTESHAGGRFALALHFAGYDALMITGEAKRLSCLVLGAHKVETHDVSFLRGADVFATGKHMRRLGKNAAGHRSSLRIGPAGEAGVAFACINVDSFRHFGRLGSGAVLGRKNLKGILVSGDGASHLPPTKAYPKLLKEIHQSVVNTPLMRKYHDLGTAENLAPLNELHALPWRNLQATHDPAVTSISGETVADNLLLRQSACAGCPVGCIHIALLREHFGTDHDFLYHQVPYDYEPLFALGTMLGVTDPHAALLLMDATEKTGLDCMSAGVALAWATEAFEKKLISENETIVPLAFGEATNYLTALGLLASRTNDFYTALGKGALQAAQKYGGADFACVLGQEMAGYATGEVFFTSQAFGFRHSHLDSGGYSFDQTSKEKDPRKAVDFLIQDEGDRVLLTSMVACLFARKVYTTERVQECLSACGLDDIAVALPTAAHTAQALRRKLQLDTGFIPENLVIPKRYTEITTWKGPMDITYLEDLRRLYIERLRSMAGNV